MVKSGEKMARKKKDISLLDVIMHVGDLGQRLTTNMNQLEQRLSKRIDENSRDIKKLETTMHERFDSLEEDLKATARDTLKIRRHVGMPVSDEF